MRSEGVTRFNYPSLLIINPFSARSVVLDSRDRRCRFWRLHNPAFDRSSWLRCGSVFAAAFCCRLAFWISNCTQEWFAAFSFYTQITPCAWWLPVALFLRRIFVRDFAHESHSGFSRWILIHFVAPGDVFLQRIVRQEFSPQIACVFVWFLSRCDFFAHY